MMDRITDKLKRGYDKFREWKSDPVGKLKNRLKGCPRKVLVLVPAGLLALCFIVGAAVYAATGNVDKNIDLRSPQYEAQDLRERFDPEDKQIYTADDGVIVIPAAMTDVQPPLAATDAADDTNAIWEADKVVTYNSFTVREMVKQEDGSLGVLNIPKLSLSVNVYQAESEMESMTKGVAHFGYTSVWDGNIGLCAHNVNLDLTDGYFKNLQLLQKGDEVRFSTGLGERVYTVSSIKEIADTDWTGLGRTPDNRITMVTCISGKPEKRLQVQAIEKR